MVVYYGSMNGDALEVPGWGRFVFRGPALFDRCDDGFSLTDAYNGVPLTWEATDVEADAWTSSNST
jgi:hypothetical protein